MRIGKKKNCKTHAISFFFFARMLHEANWVASLAESMAVVLMQCPLLVMARIWNLAMVLAIGHLFFSKE